GPLGHGVWGEYGGPHRPGWRLVAWCRQPGDGGLGGFDQFGPPFGRDVLPVAIVQRTFDRIEQVERRFETGALDAHEGLHRPRFRQVLPRAEPDLSQPRLRLGPDVAKLGGLVRASASMKTAPIASRPAWSSASKRPFSGLSMSNTPTRRSPCTSGTTTSERDAESQAMWPGKASTSSTRWVRRLLAAAPQTPLSSGIRTHAGCPWNGPTTSSRPSKT